MTTAEPIDLRITVNGEVHDSGRIPGDLPLVELLHEELGLTGSKFCCGIGVCRACTVAVRRRPGARLETLLSCSTPVSAVNGMEVMTVEGLAREGELTALQQAFLDRFAFQCGYCTPGFLIAATLMLQDLEGRELPRSDLDREIDSACGAHVCRCTGYQRYHEAIREVAENTPGLLAAEPESE